MTLCLIKVNIFFCLFGVWEVAFRFDEGQIVMGRRGGQSISKAAALVGCSQFVLVSFYQKWSKQGTVVNQQQVEGVRGYEI